MNKFIDKLFYLNAWTVGYRQIEDGATVLPSKSYKGKYNTISLNDHMYYADPFVFEDNGDTYLFVESMNRYRGKATISVSKFENGKFRNFKEIIREPFHMSYPNVFRHNNDYYLIPETVASGQVRLYKAKEFPYNWEFSKVLLENGNEYTDNSIECIGNDVFFYAYYENDGSGITECYKFDFENLKLNLFNPGIVLHNERPAGNVFCINGVNYRPIQDCKDYYGNAIKVFSHNCGEGETLEVIVDKSCYDVIVKKITGTHTLNRSKHFEVIDFKYDRFCFTRRLIWLVNKFRR